MLDRLNKHIIFNFINVVEIIIVFSIVKHVSWSISATNCIALEIWCQNSHLPAERYLYLFYIFVFALAVLTSYTYS